MLSLLTGTSMSAAEVARELGISHANASYHLRLLRDAGLLDVAGQEKIRGGVAIRYHHPADATARTSDPLETDLVVSALADELIRRAQQRDPEAAFRFTDAELWLRPEDWQRTSDAVMTASQTANKNAQPPHTPGTVQVSLSVAAFQMTQD